MHTSGKISGFKGNFFGESASFKDIQNINNFREGWTEKHLKLKTSNSINVLWLKKRSNHQFFLFYSPQAVFWCLLEATGKKIYPAFQLSSPSHEAFGHICCRSFIRSGASPGIVVFSGPPRSVVIISTADWTVPNVRVHRKIAQSALQLQKVWGGWLRRTGSPL